MRKSKTMIKVGAIAALAAVGAAAVPALAHHSYAMFDQTRTVTLTGIAYRYAAIPTHAELHFYMLGPDGKLVKKDGKNADFGVEMAGAAGMARQGITAATFPPGTILSVKVNPMRNGSNFGSLASGIAKCPWRTPPAPGMACDSVAGHELLGAKTF